MQNWGSRARGRPLPPSISRDQPSTGELHTHKLLEPPRPCTASLWAPALQTLSPFKSPASVPCPIHGWQHRQVICSTSRPLAAARWAVEPHQSHAWQRANRYEVVQTQSAFLQPSQLDAQEVSVIHFSLTDLTFWVCKWAISRATSAMSFKFKWHPH